MSATVRVRILVAVDTEGKWASFGHAEHTDKEAKGSIFFDDLKEIFRWSWIEAEIPLPEAEQTIEGSVSDGGTE